jgi:hypothetical protein
MLPVLWALVCLCGCSEAAGSAPPPPLVVADGGESSPAVEVPLLAPEPASTDGHAQDSNDDTTFDSQLARSTDSVVHDATDFLGEVSDSAVRNAMKSGAILGVEKGRGGRSLGFRLTLAGGQKAYFKPEQTFSAANWFGEVAAYHLDRMLGLGRVPCVVSRTLPWSELEAAAGKDVRKSEIILNNGMAHGALVAWVQGNLMPLPETEGWERWVRVKHWPSAAISPFQRPAVWKAQLQAQKRMGEDFRSKEDRQRMRALNPEPDRDDRPAELSDLILFDYLTKNGDRWGGGNANVLIRGERGPLVFLDNGAGFEPGDHRPGLMEARLHMLQRFRRSTIRAIRAFDMQRFRLRLATEAVQPVLSDNQLHGLAERRAALLAWVDEQERQFGEAIWAWE